MFRPQGGLGEEAQIRDLLGLFKDSIMKTGEDLNMLAGKFDCDLKKSCKPKLEGHMKILVDLERQLALEKDAATEAMNKISCAFSDWNAWPNNTDDDENQEVEYDENGEPIVNDWASTWESERPSNPDYDKILSDEQYDLFLETLNKIKESRKSKRKQDPRVKALKTLLSLRQSRTNNTSVVGGDEEEEIIASTQDTIPIDPITKKKITDPVKNVKCGHIYDKNGMIDFLKAPNPRCPYMGCVNRAQIRPTDLVPDEELKQKIDYLMALEEADESESGDE